MELWATLVAEEGSLSSWGFGVQIRGWGFPCEAGGWEFKSQPDHFSSIIVLWATLVVRGVILWAEVTKTKTYSLINITLILLSFDFSFLVSVAHKVSIILFFHFSFFPALNISILYLFFSFLLIFSSPFLIPKIYIIFSSIKFWFFNVGPLFLLPVSIMNTLHVYSDSF